MGGKDIYQKEIDGHRPAELLQYLCLLSADDDGFLTE
jgi:hypothetical protein